jgi:NADP-dependent 3-hydroxy acid dehydrogenase YdfG
MSAQIDLTGRRVLLTGASSGLGAETARTLVGCGASVAMLARRLEKLEALQAELGERAIPVATDVTDLDSLEAGVNTAAERLGGMDAVVIVAGQGMAGAIATGTPKLWRNLVELNLIAPLTTVRSAYEHFDTSVRRDIVVVGSAAAITAMPGTGIYSASKRGLEAACDALRLEVAGDGVNVGLVVPGMFETEGLTVEGLVLDEHIPHNDFPLFAEGGKVGDPAVVAHCIAFMLSLPEGVAINELVARPTGQLNP